MRVKEAMTPTIDTIQHDATLKDAAVKMEELNIGVLPVSENGHLVGILTDRDIVVRAIAQGRTPSKTRVRDVMSPDVVCCYEDQEVLEAAYAMEERRLRRLAVLNREGKAVGVLSLGDIAIKSSDFQLAGEVLYEVSTVRPTARS